MTKDRLLTINDYYDGPRLGVAELNGKPHIYEAEFDYSTEDFGDTYFLSPIDDDLFLLVMEEWSIWKKWDEAFKENKTQQSTHPALPNDRKRYEELKILIGDRLKTDPNNRLYFRAKFGIKGTTVEWCHLEKQ